MNLFDRNGPLLSGIVPPPRAAHEDQRPWSVRFTDGVRANRRIIVLTAVLCSLMVGCGALNRARSPERLATVAELQGMPNPCLLLPTDTLVAAGVPVVGKPRVNVRTALPGEVQCGWTGAGGRKNIVAVAAVNDTSNTTVLRGSAAEESDVPARDITVPGVHDAWLQSTSAGAKAAGQAGRIALTVTVAGPSQAEASAKLLAAMAAAIPSQ